MPTLVPMFLSPMEMLVILAVALLVFGTSKLSGLGKGIGRSIREFKEEIQSDPEKKTDPQITNNAVNQPKESDSAASNNETSGLDDKPKS